MDENRKICEWCGEELAHAAYFRHLFDKDGSVCFGKNCQSTRDRTDGFNHVDDLDSTFELESEGDNDKNELFSLGSDQNERYLRYFTDISLSDSDSDMTMSSNEISSLDGEELWDLSESESDEGGVEVNPKVSNVLYGFLNLYHLCYQLSERAIVALLKFIGILFRHLAAVCNNPLLTDIARVLPKSLYKIHKYFKGDYQCIEYAVCPKCDNIYLVDDCFINQSGIQESRVCSHIEFPNHPHSSKRTTCNRVKLGKGSKLVPRKLFVYHSVVESIKDMARRHGFLEMCEHWRNRKDMSSKTLGDVYDGWLWKNLQTSNRFLSIPNNLCLGLNIDWFNPFSETIYSVGAIYLTVLNLPRTDRFKLENMILIGMIPGPKEPKNLNPFLKPLIEELKQLYLGITFKNTSSLLSLTRLRAMLFCVMCDLPATRKVCGFSSFNAVKGCSKCLKDFLTPTFGEKPDYSGFDCECWIPLSSLE